MKKCIKLIILVLLIASMFLFGNIISNAACNHEYKYYDCKNGSIHYICNKCNQTICYNIIQINKMFSPSMINCYDSAVKNGEFVDIVDDGIINAKDYAKIRNEYKKFKRTPDIDDGGGF